MNELAAGLRRRPSDAAPPELRHFSAFQQVYLTRDYTAAGHDLNIDRKGILRLMDRLEQTFQNVLFTEPRRGTLIPSPFADRLFNDLRLLNTARESLSNQVAEIRSTGRSLRIGGSPTVFRTPVFRKLFRELQISEKIRASYVPVSPAEASKALATGICDLHVGCGRAGTGRFTSQGMSEISFRMIERNGRDATALPSAPLLVLLDGIHPESLPEEMTAHRPLEEKKFLHWMDHPEECPPGTRIFAPDIPCDPAHWTSVEPDTAVKREIHVQFLRQHPYEFLPALVSGIKTRMSPQ